MASVFWQGGEPPKLDNYFKLPACVANSHILPFRTDHRFDLGVGHGVVPVLNMTVEQFRRYSFADEKVWTMVFVQEGYSEICSHTFRHHWCCICDGRIAATDYLDQLIWLGSPRPSVETATRVYKWFAKDPEGLEQFTDPERYWLARYGYKEGGKVSFYL